MKGENKKMSNEKNETVRKAYICFLDENNIKRDGYVELIKFDASFVKFRTRGNIITLPTARILKIKEKDNGGGE